MADVKLPELPESQSMFNCHTSDGRVFTTEQMRSYATRAVRHALENQERVCCVETDSFGFSTFTKHNLPPSSGLVGLAIIPLPEGL